MSKEGSEGINIPDVQARNSANCSPGRASSGRSPSTGTGHFLLPESPVPQRRQRTVSWSERVSSSQSFRGTVKSFCRQKGHGFIAPADGTEPLFCHVSDIDGDYVPKAGDEVTFKKMIIPPKNVKYEAVHVQILRMNPGVKHETWEQAPAPQNAGDTE